MLVVCSVAYLAGCGSNPNAGERNFFSSKLGANCKIQFRRGDCLGASGGNPVPPITDSINGAEVSLAGKLQAARDGWFVIVRADNEYRIPRESILLIEFGS